MGQEQGKRFIGKRNYRQIACQERNITPVILSPLLNNFSHFDSKVEGILVNL